jgi:hypothetical protein
VPRPLPPVRSRAYRCRPPNNPLLVSPLNGQSSHRSVLSLVSPHNGQSSHWSVLSSVSPHIGQSSQWSVLACFAFIAITHETVHVFAETIQFSFVSSFPIADTPKPLLIHGMDVAA